MPKDSGFPYNIKKRGLVVLAGILSVGNVSIFLKIYFMFLGTLMIEKIENIEKCVQLLFIDFNRNIKNNLLNTRTKIYII